MARVIVGVKRVLDYNIPVQVKSDNTGVDVEGYMHNMNPFDEIAVEQAVQMKERNEVSEVIAVCCGPTKGEETLRTALAMGADRGLLIEVPGPQYETLQPIHISKILAKVARDEQADMIFVGKQAIDDDCNQTAQMTAAQLDWPQGTFASKIEITNGELKVMREIDGGLENIKIKLPAVISADLRLNEPRYCTMPSIMKARKKPLKKVALSELGVDVRPRIEVLRVEDPPERVPGPILPNVDALIEKLRQLKFI